MFQKRLIQALVLVPLIFLAIKAHASNLKGSYSWSIEGKQIEEQEVLAQSTLTSFYLGADFRHRLTQQFSLYFSPAFIFASGRSQALIIDKRPRNSFYANQAKVSFRLVRALIVQAGAINQDFLGNSQLVSNRAFPAAKLKIRLFPRSWGAHLNFENQVAIPTSYTFSTEAEAEEPTPTLTTSTLTLKWKPFDELSVKAGMTYFQFSQLPQVVAVDSVLLGNTVDQFSTQTAAFAYEFKGFSGNASGKFKLPDGIDLNLGTTAIINTEALEGFNRGYSVSGGFDIHLPKSMLLGLSLKHFRVEPDTSPAYYNSSSQPNNRMGFTYKAYYRFKNSNFQVSGSYSHMTRIYVDDLMGERSVVYFSVETLGASI